MAQETTDKDPESPLNADFTILGNPPGTQPRSCPAGPVSGQVPGQVIDDRILENHFFPGLVFEFQGSDGRRAAGRRDLPFLSDACGYGDASSQTGTADPSDPGGLSRADIEGNGILLCAVNVEGTENDFRFYGWTGNDRAIALEAADAIRCTQTGLSTRILLIHEDLFRPRGQADITAALNAYTSGAFMADRVERRNERFLWAVLTARTRTLLYGPSGLLGFEGPAEAPVSIIAAGDLQRGLSTPWQAGYGRDFDCISFMNTWETSPVSLDAAGANADEREE